MKHLLFFFGVIALAACSDNTASNQDKSAKTVIDHQIKALEKAKRVEAQVLEAAQQQRVEIDSH